MVSVTLNFGVKIEVPDLENIDELGIELAAFLQESFFNGEDVVEVIYNGRD